MKEIIVLSGKGGTGKTTVTAALATIASQRLNGSSGLVVADCDVDAADLHLVLGPLPPGHLETNEFISGDLAFIDPDRCLACGDCALKCRFGAIAEAADGTYTVRPELCEGCGLCHHVCTVDAVRMEPRRCGEWYVSETRHGAMVHARLDIGAENSGKLVTTVRNRSRILAESKGADTVLTDGPPGIGCAVIASLTNADLALLVTEPTVSAIHDLGRVHDLTKHFKIPCAVLINKADVNPELAKSIENWCEDNEVAHVGTLGYDPGFTRAQIEGKTVTEAAPDLAPVFDAIWNRINAVAQDKPVEPIHYTIQGVF